MRLTPLLASWLAVAPPSLPATNGEATPLDDLQLSWSAPAECPTAEQVIERLRLLAPELSLATPGASARISAQVRVEPTPAATLSVQLELVGTSGVEQRVFEAEDCRVAADAVVLMLVVAIDPAGAATRIDVQPRGADDEPPAKPSPAVETTPEADSFEKSMLSYADRDPGPLPPRRRIEARFLLAGYGGGGYGPVAAGSAVVGLRLGALGQGWRWELRGGWLPPARRDVEALAISIDGFVVATRACWVAYPGPVELPLCGGLEGGAIRARAQAPQDLTPGGYPFLGVVPSLGLRWAPVDRFALGIDLDVPFNLISWEFALVGQPVLSSVVVGARATAALEVRLP